ncbi:hypothetical protein ACCQ10_04630 [Xanthomonas sp. NCPPB 1325]|uniref:hypothetical protein n=1 Tax=Xanthomonas sp. NCPPB 1325 TaxID=487529 RepID=UPI0035576DC7
MLMHRDGVVRAEDIQLSPQRLPSRLGDEPPADGQALLARAFARPFETGDAALHATVKEQLFRAAYRHCDQNQVRTAALLGVSRNVVRARLIAQGELVVNTRSGRGAPARRRMTVPSDRHG